MLLCQTSKACDSLNRRINELLLIAINKPKRVNSSYPDSFYYIPSEAVSTISILDERLSHTLFDRISNVLVLVDIFYLQEMGLYDTAWTVKPSF
jgi:hypothetical protein